MPWERNEPRLLAVSRRSFARRDNVQPDPEIMLQIMGLQALVVKELKDEAVVLWDHDLILLRAGLAHDDLMDVLDQALSLSVAELAGSADESGVGLS